MLSTKKEGIRRPSDASWALNRRKQSGHASKVWRKWFITNDFYYQTGTWIIGYDSTMKRKTYTCAFPKSTNKRHSLANWIKTAFESGQFLNDFTSRNHKKTLKLWKYKHYKCDFFFKKATNYHKNRYTK